MKSPTLSAMALTATALFLAAPAGAQRDKDAWKAATPTGEPISCLRAQDIRETRVRDDQTIDFYLRNRDVFRNTLPGSCPQLGFEQRFAYRTTINQLCSVDTITVLLVNSPSPGATCGLGKFQPVTGAPR